MKALSYIIIIVFSASFLSAQEYGWVDISDNLPIDAGYLTASFFIDENEGWIAAGHAYAIYHTSDGGQSFEIQTIAQPANVIFMIDKDRGYAGGQSALFYTNNGGREWKLLTGFLPSTIRDISVPPECDTGFVCGDNGWVAKFDSTYIFDSEKLVNAGFTGIYFHSINEGWVAGGSIIRHYIDGEWTADLSAMLGYWGAMSFYDSQTGWIAGDGGQIIKTGNGHDFVQQLAYGDGYTVTDIFAATALNVWCVSHNYISFTIDGGASWEIDSGFASNYSFYTIFFPAETTGYLVGLYQDADYNNYPALFKYTDETSIDEEINIKRNIVFPNPAKEYIVIKPLQTSAIEIYNVLGEKVYTETIHPMTPSHRMNISYLQPGVYILHYGNKSEIFVKE